MVTRSKAALATMMAAVPPWCWSTSATACEPLGWLASLRVLSSYASFSPLLAPSVTNSQVQVSACSCATPSGFATRIASLTLTCCRGASLACGSDVRIGGRLRLVQMFGAFRRSPEHPRSAQHATLH